MKGIKDGFLVLKDILSTTMYPPGGPPDNSGKQLKNPVIINEYAWMWVNRNGRPTLLTDNIFANLFPEANTSEKRLEVYAKVLAMKTEYWRSHRKVAGVLEFCGLSYSRPFPPRGQTSDHLKDVRNVVYDPYFVKYVRPAFNPIGIMLDFWDPKPKAGSEISFNIIMINDTYDKWTGQVKVFITGSDESRIEKSFGSEISPLGRVVFPQSFTIPRKSGFYKLTAEFIYNGEPVISIREFRID
jgi:hypothetical protein